MVLSGCLMDVLCEHGIWIIGEDDHYEALQSHVIA